MASHHEATLGYQRDTRLMEASSFASSAALACIAAKQIEREPNVVLQSALDAALLEVRKQLETYAAQLADPDAYPPQTVIGAVLMLNSVEHLHGNLDDAAEHTRENLAKVSALISDRTSGDATEALTVLEPLSERANRAAEEAQGQR